MAVFDVDVVSDRDNSPAIVLRRVPGTPWLAVAAACKEIDARIEAGDIADVGVIIVSDEGGREVLSLDVTEA